MLIMHDISNCVCYGSGNSQNVAPVGDLCDAGNTRAC